VFPVPLTVRHNYYNEAFNFSIVAHSYLINPSGGTESCYPCGISAPPTATATATAVGAAESNVEAASTGLILAIVLPIIFVVLGAALLCFHYRENIEGALAGSSSSSSTTSAYEKKEVSDVHFESSSSDNEAPIALAPVEEFNSVEVQFSSSPIQFGEFPADDNGSALGDDALL
jgi:hypothetical protein